MRSRVATRTKAVAYARVSSKEQEAEGFSVDAQLRLLRNYAADQGFDIEREFVEVETAKRSGRRAFGEMLRHLDRSPKRVILVEKVDRLYRNFADYVKVDHLSVELHFVKDGMVISESSKSQDKFMHGIRVLMAKNYVDNLSEEIRKGLNEKAAQGIYPSHAPLGYLNVQEAGTKRKIIVPDPARAHHVKQLFEIYASGLYSLSDLTKLACSLGLTSKKGLPLPKSAISKVLAHPAYAGIIRWNGVESLGIHEPLVSREVWLTVQDVRTGRGSRNAGYGSIEFAYRGLIHCVCGDVMSGERKKGKYIYYHCTGRRRELCGRRYIAEATITKAFTELLKKLEVPAEFVPWIEAGLREADKDRHANRDSREKAIDVEAKTLRARLERLYTDQVDGEIGKDFYRETRTKWESRLTDLELERAALDRTETLSVDETMRVFELASTAHIRFQNADSNQKRELLHFMCSNCLWKDGQLVVELHQFFDLMLNTLDSTRTNDGEEPADRLAKVKSVNWWR